MITRKVMVELTEDQNKKIEHFKVQEGFRNKQDAIRLIIDQHNNRQIK